MLFPQFHVNLALHGAPFILVPQSWTSNYYMYCMQHPVCLFPVPGQPISQIPDSDCQQLSLPACLPSKIQLILLLLSFFHFLHIGMCGHHSHHHTYFFFFFVPYIILSKEITQQNRMVQCALEGFACFGGARISKSYTCHQVLASGGTGQCI